jgi:hypothetical protein
VPFGEYAVVQGTLLRLAAMAQLATGYTAAKYLAEAPPGAGGWNCSGSASARSPP